MTGAVLFIARTQARRRWRALVGLIVFVGLLGGLSLSLIAGSRRSASVVDRYLATARGYDLEFFGPMLTRSAVTSIAGVTRADPQAYVAMIAAERGGQPPAGINGVALDFDALDPTYRLLEGAVPDGSDPAEVLVNEFFVEQFGRSVGDRFLVQMFRRDQEEEVGSGIYDAKGPKFELSIAGVIRPPQDVAVDEVHALGGSSTSDANAVALPIEFYQAHRHEFLDFGPAYSVKLRDGRANRERFVAALDELAPLGSDRPVIAPVSSTTRRASLDAPVQIETSALLALGIGLAVAGAIATALVVRAEQRALDDDTPTLRTLGFTGRQLGLASIARNTPVALGGVLIAGALAYGLSGRYPIGIGRQLELQGGPETSVAVLGLGALAIVTFVVGLSFLFGRPPRVPSAPPTRRLTLARWLGEAGAPTGLVLGTQLAFERGRGVRSVPTRSAIVGGAAALAIVTGLAIYVGGIDHLYSARPAHGWPWDAAIGNTNFPLSSSTVEALATDERIRDRTQTRYGDANVDGTTTEFLAFDSDGDAPPAVVAGRLPVTATEVALGRATMDALDVQVGSTVTFSVLGGEFDEGSGTTPRTMRVVGQSLPPIFGESDLGEVGIVTFDGLQSAGGAASPRHVLVRVRDGRERADLLSLRGDYTEEITIDAVPARIVNLHRVRGLPLIGLLLAGCMGTIALVYTLAVSARARARELAVLRALGLASRRLRGVLACQGLVIGAAMLLIGVPIGYGVGTAIWNTVAEDLGVTNDLTVSPLILLFVPLTLGVAVVASLYPSRRARRQPVTTLLRVE